MVRLLVALGLGLLGTGILGSLGVWQVKRLAEKQALLAEIQAMIDAPPVALPALVDPGRDRFLPVTVAGRLTGESARVLAAEKGPGAGVHLIAVMDTGARRVLVDLGFLAEGQVFVPEGAWEIAGNLHWPRDADGYTPPPDLARGLWFSRAVAPLAQHLRTDPVLVVARSALPEGPAPRPVGPEGIRNDHLSYAVTWFLLAATWAGMTAYLMWRIRRGEA
jgi:surfeit locus 1 family protein